MKKRPEPATAIISGVCIIGFGLFYHFAGIFPGRWGAVTAGEDPARFRLAVLVALLVGAAALVWGLLNLRRR